MERSSSHASLLHWSGRGEGLVWCWLPPKPVRNFTQCCWVCSNHLLGGNQEYAQRWYWERGNVFRLKRMLCTFFQLKEVGTEKDVDGWSLCWGKQQGLQFQAVSCSHGHRGPSSLGLQSKLDICYSVLKCTSWWRAGSELCMSYKHIIGCARVLNIGFKRLCI